MSQLIDIKVPDIGDFTEVPVIEVFVKPGDVIKVDDALVTLESDKATMDVPASAAGVVRDVLVKLGDKIGEGTVVVRVEANDASVAAPTEVAPRPPVAEAPTAQSAPAINAVASSVIDVKVPDIGDFAEVPVIEIFVKPGDTVNIDDALVTLESDKATMDVPSSAAGTVREVLVKLGDKVGEGSVIVRLDSSAGASTPTVSPPAVPESVSSVAEKTSSPVRQDVAAQSASGALIASLPSLPLGSAIHASPGIRAYARELGVDLTQVKATGPKNRILREDVTGFVKGAMSTGVVPGKTPAIATGVTGSGAGLDLLPWPKVDFAKFGPVDVQPLSRIKKISGQNLSRNWVMIPAVTYHEDADITELEAFRVQLNKENEKGGGAKLTMLAFLIKACVKALQKYPEFNSSLDGDNLVMKQYFNIAFAADTPNGLVVPVIKNADKKSVFELAQESGDLAKQARDGKLKPADMQGACFTISSLGGIGGTYFAPIVNAPEVAILGVNKSAMKPVWDGKQFVPRLTLPLSLTADHRVIDGALATRFNVYLAQLLADFRRVAL